MQRRGQPSSGTLHCAVQCNAKAHRASAAGSWARRLSIHVPPPISPSPLINSSTTHLVSSRLLTHVYWINRWYGAERCSRLDVSQSQGRGSIDVRYVASFWRGARIPVCAPAPALGGPRSRIFGPRLTGWPIIGREWWTNVDPRTTEIGCCLLLHRFIFYFFFKKTRSVILYANTISNRITWPNRRGNNWTKRSLWWLLVYVNA